MGEAGQQWLEGSAEELPAGGGKGAERFAVKGARCGDEVGAAGVDAGKFEGAFDRFGAAVDHETVGEVAGGYFGQQG